MNRLQKAAKTRLKQIKKLTRGFEREAKLIGRLFGKRKPRKKKALTHPRKTKKRPSKPRPAVALAA